MTMNQTDHDVLGFKSSKHPVQVRAAVRSLKEYLDLMMPGHSDSHRTEFEKALPKNAPDQSEGDNANQELISHVYGGSDLQSALASSHLKNAFPSTADVFAGDDIVISKDIVIGPNHAPYAIHANTLTFDGGSLTIIATALSINVNKLMVTNKAGSTKPYHIGILGTVGAKGASGNPGKPYSEPAEPGVSRSPSSPGVCSSETGGQGSEGTVGASGYSGHVGATGQRSLPATISIKTMDATSSPIIFYTKSGAGGNGGDGGAGGTGQPGGQGGHGCNSGCEGSVGGDGGDGGKGGVGGEGARGGNGADGNPISITFPSASRDKLQTEAEHANPGEGGKGGLAGNGGAGGNAGGGGKHHAGGRSGGGGESGTIGKSGLVGAHTGAPGNFVFHYI